MMVLRGSFTVRLKCEEGKGRKPSRQVLRQAMKALVMSFRLWQKSVRIKKTEFDSSVCWGWACDLKSILKEAERHKTALEALGIKLTNFI